MTAELAGGQGSQQSEGFMGMWVQEPAQQGYRWQQRWEEAGEEALQVPLAEPILK